MKPASPHTWKPLGQAFVCGLVLIWLLADAVHAQHARNLLSGRYGLEDLRADLTPRAHWHPYPTATEPEGWLAVPEDIREAYIEAGEALLGTAWPSLPATVLLEYVRTGNRSNYQDLSFARRQQLTTLVLAEVFDGQGRFVDDIVNGVWAISEETYWGVPAHLSLQKAGFGLPDAAEPTVDLFAAETGALLAWTLYLVGDRLDSVSPLLRERIHLEVDRRILTPNLERDDFWWMGLDGGFVNNWNPWVSSNWLTAVLLLERDEERRRAAVYKILRVLDQFINSYPDDGGCDEGPSYWSRAGGSLFDTLELLHHATNGALDLFDHPLIREMGRYVHRSYISDRYYLNFADAPAQLNVDPALVYRYGHAIDDETMTRFAAFAARQDGWDATYLSTRLAYLNRRLPALFVLDDLRATTPAEPLLRDVWLPDLQVMCARSEAGSRAGFYLAAKGGHNDESHNHNDVGHFVVYRDGRPVLIDVGVGVYTAKTFSADRYTIWNMQSAYHNLPTLNGVMQQQGRAFAARDVVYKATDREVTFTLDLAGAYPEEAGVASWVRRLTLRRGRDITIRETYQLHQFTEPFTLQYMTPLTPSTEQPGTIVLQARTTEQETSPEVVARLSYDPDRFTVRYEPIDLTDARMQQGWGDHLTRIVLSSTREVLKDTFTLRLR